MRMGEPHYFEQAIYETLRYFDLFDLPLTATQLWRFLLVQPSDRAERWAGHRRLDLKQIRQLLSTSAWLAHRTDTKWGYYFLKDRKEIVTERLRRHAIAQTKWKILRRVAYALAAVPFVKALAGSGSLALYNTKSTSDLDVFVITHPKRIWTARLLLLAVTQLMGRRRKYWNEAAPDKVCLNHYITTTSLVMAPEIRSVYTAALYTHLVALYGAAVWHEFQEVNALWLKARAMYADASALPSPLAVRLPGWVEAVKSFSENLLLEPLGDLIERLAERLQRRVIEQHTHPNQGGRVAVSKTELAFHPHSKADRILFQLAQDEGQRALL